MGSQSVLIILAGAHLCEDPTGIKPYELMYKRLPTAVVYDNQT